MPGTVFLEAEKISLRTVEEEDIEFLRDGVNKPGVRVHTGNRRPKNLRDEEEFFEEQVCGGETADLLITRNGERLGVISLVPEGDTAERVAEIGIWLHPTHHGNGYEMEAARLITEHGFKQLNYHKFFGRVHADNEASHRIWEKLGFEKEGELRDQTFTKGEYEDVVYYGVLEDEWQ